MAGWPASAAAGSVALIVGALVLAYVDRHRVPGDLTGWDFSDVFAEVANLAVPVVGFVLASRRPANRIGWLFLAAGLALGAGWLLRPPTGCMPWSRPPGRCRRAGRSAWLSNWIWVIPFAVLAFVFLLFPTGRLRSRGGARPPGSWAGRSRCTGVVLLVHATRVWSHPFGPSSRGRARCCWPRCSIIVLAALVVSVAAVVVRFARSSGEERLQLKWFAAAAVLVVVTLIPIDA